MIRESIAENEPKRNQIIKWVIAGIVLGICFVVFYTVAHPMYIYDTDDWTYIANSRHAWPTTKEWNPTKILPETLMPLTAEMGIRFIMPFSGDYIGSMAIAFALVVTSFIVAYVLIFGKTAKELFDLHTSVIFFIIALFALYHFLPFNVSDTGNKYLFYGGNVNCYFNYLVPGLFNATLVMYLINHRQNEWRDKGRYVQKGVLILFIYLCVNSNMFHSIILASFAGMNSLIWVISEKERYWKKQGIKQFCVDFVRENTLWLLILIVWLGSLVFEMQGGRAARASTSFLELPIGMTFFKFIQSVENMNKLYLISVLLFIVLAILIYIFIGRKENKEQDKRYISWFVKISICMVVTWGYLILLCAKVSPEYMVNNLVEFSWMFWFMLLGFLSLSYIMAKVPYMILILPLCFYVVVFETIVDGSTYAENSVTQFDSTTVKALDENIIEQMIEADEAGLTDVTVYIPVHSSESWPMNISYGGSRIARTLFLHGVVSRQMNVTLVMDQSINDAYHLP